MSSGTMKGKLKLIFGILLAVVLIIAVSIIFITFSGGDTIRKGVKIEGVDVAGKDIHEVRNMVSSVINDKYAGKDLVLSYDDNAWRYTVGDISYEFMLDDALEKAMTVGKEGNIFKRIYDSVVMAFGGMDIKLDSRYDKDKVLEILNSIKKEIDRKPQNASVAYSDGKIDANEHITGLSMDVEKNARIIESKLKARDFSGIVLDIKTTAPKIVYDDIKNIDSVISEFNTRFSLSDINRGDNIRLACKRLNARILLPGDIFSMNKSLGPRTLENGYKEAPIIFQNELIPGTGGGICQVTTTLYNTVLLGKLKVLERSHHSMPLGYVKPGQDATIAEDSIDFKFQNNNNYAVCLNTEVNGGKIVIRLLGKNNPSKRVVKLQSEIIKTVKPGQDEVIIDESLADGEKVVVKKSRMGVRAVLYRDTYSADNLFLDREKISEDYYKPVRGQVKMNSNYKYISVEVSQNE